MGHERLENNKTIQILRAASKGKYGIPAPLAFNIEHILGFVKAAERKRSPLIIQLFPWAITWSDGLLVHAAAHAARNATVPIAVHLDHCQEESMVKRAAELPFDSIMVDMSHHSKAENLAKTKQWVAYCHARGKATEAEPGRIEGGEDGIADTVDLSGVMTTQEEAQQFVESGVDILAPAFGNVHGEYGPRGIVLDWDRLATVQKITSAGDVHLALHGVLFFSEELTRNLIEAGITKINLNRDTLVDYYDHLKKNVGKIPFTQLLEEAVEVLAEATGKQMDIALSTGKA
ncbi:tagatose-bisphosphate aldolase [Rhizodiscina lignyota]|uniref:Fructose-bisphosphate aldolase n=1 Tax=Rhizodiscina lignyota TaxID=1504668 RepID=A0A9P4IAJ0_9PEZI|nr:tagatose-bisphosphate aldolase [Rhizodiscina lignyota]